MVVLSDANASKLSSLERIRELKIRDGGSMKYSDGNIVFPRSLNRAARATNREY